MYGTVVNLLRASYVKKNKWLCKEKTGEGGHQETNGDSGVLQVGILTKRKSLSEQTKNK